MKNEMNLNRRAWMKNLGIGSISLAVIGCESLTSPESFDESSEEQNEITPAEDLMFEHGVIERLLLIYDEFVKLIESNENFSQKLIYDTSDIIRLFCENYHEKNEEQYVFPYLKQMGLHTDLVTILQNQHDLGRKVTDNITELSQKQKPDLEQLAKEMKSYTFMYIPHISRENSVIFRTLAKTMIEKDYKELGEKFEGTEDEHLGANGYNNTLSKVISVEKELGINSLTKFSPVF